MIDTDAMAVTGYSPKLWRPTPAQFVALDIVLVTVAFLVGRYVSSVEPIKFDGTPAHVTVYVLWFMVSVGFLFRHRYPRTTLGVLLVLLFAGLLLRSSAPVSTYLAFLMYSVAVTSSRRGASVAAGIALLSTATGIVIGGGAMQGGAIIGVAANLLIGWLAGEYVRTGRSHAAIRAQFIAEKAVTDERTKLARELHDVVAHGMSVVAVRAGIARMVVETRPDQVREALSIIETTTRSTLQEMRLLVGVLRRGGEPEATRGPAPGLDNLPQLLHTAELTGLNIELEVSGTPRGLAPALDLSAYRIVQEALTNAARHAGPTTAHVAIDYGVKLLDIEVRDDGPPIGPAPVNTTADELRRTGTGHGLIGIRERAALFGGRCATGPLGPGFHVHVVLDIIELQENPLPVSPYRDDAPDDAAPVPTESSQ